MAEIIGLGKIRKIRARAEKEKTAQNNRVKFGRTKLEKNLNKARQAQAKHLLDGHKLDNPKKS